MYMDSGSTAPPLPPSTQFLKDSDTHIAKSSALFKLGFSSEFFSDIFLFSSCNTFLKQVQTYGLQFFLEEYFSILFALLQSNENSKTIESHHSLLKLIEWGELCLISTREQDKAAISLSIT